MTCLLVWLAACGDDGSQQPGPASTTEAPRSQTATADGPPEEGPDTGDGESGSEDSGEERAAARLDLEVEETLDALTAAAQRGDQGVAARLAQRLDELSRRDNDERPPGPLPEDPFLRMLERFPIKRAPLFAQQITSTEDGHELLVGVQPAIFCLKPAAERRTAAEAVYSRQDRHLRQRGVRDFAFVVVPVGAGNPTRDDALAIGEDGALRLTARGRRC
jgi:hypothetical protein